MQTEAPLSRIDRIDLVRGLAMVLMTLDHTRDFFGNHDMDALDLAATTPALFFSRWLTHLCATAFVFLAGSSAFLQSLKNDRPALTRFLLSRGLLLIVLEQTVLRCLGWYFNVDYRYMNANVLWGIGGSMVLLAGFVWLPRPTVLVTAMLLIVFHDLLLQLISLSEKQAGYSLWVMLMQGGEIEYLPDHHFYVSYPFLPWFGILALGYGMGQCFLTKFKWEYAGVLCLLAFVVIRAFFSYGNPTPWQPQKNTFFTFLSFISVEKYPPSLLYTLLTLGIVFLLLSLAPKLPQAGQAVLRVFGRVPLFFYVLHITIIHALAILLAWLRFGRAEWLYNGPGIFWSETLPGHPPGYGLSLVWVYLITAGVVVLLYPVCRWYARQRKQHEWLRYY